MTQKCPNPKCQSPDTPKFGAFRRRSDGKWVKRWWCKKCKLHFSSSTLHRTYRQHKWRVNPHIFKLLSSGVSMRRIAILLDIHRITVARKLKFLSQLARERQVSFLGALPKARHVQFDDLITLEHNKCKPLAISLAVDASTRRILGYEVSRIHASGHLAGISRRKYGPRPNERP